MSSENPAPAGESRWRLLRDVLVFQTRLGVDALRDLVLSPVSLAAAVLDLLSGTDRERPYFYQVLQLGQRSERWINLFGEADRITPGAETEAGERASLDRVVRRVEALVVEQYEHGGMTAQAKARIDRTLDALAPRRAAPPPRDEAP